MSVFAALCKAHGLPEPIPEYRFDPQRKWRLDWAFNPDGNRVGLEVQGGTFIQGRHSRGPALLKEYEKLRRLAALGWRVLFCTPQQFASGEILPDLCEAMTWATVGGP